MGVTAHWIKGDSTRKSAALACRRFKGSHTYDCIAELLLEIFAEYEINVRKIVATVTDNGSNFVKAFKEYAQVDGEDMDEDEEDATMLI